MIYCYRCPKCGNKKEITLSIEEMEGVRDGKLFLMALWCCQSEMVRDFRSEGLKFGVGMNSSKQCGGCADYDDGEIWRYKQGLPTDREAARLANMSRSECQKLKPKYKRRQPKYYKGGVEGK